MTKKHMLIADAERLYIVEQMTIEEVAEKIKVNEKTVRNWKSEGNWDVQRQKYIQSKQMFHEDLYNFARKLMTSIETAIENGEKVDPGRMFAFTKMLPMITKIKEYEDIAVKKDAKKEPKKGLSKNVIDLIESEILGIK